RLCAGPCAPIWDFVTRHVRHPRNVKKIRGNLLWYPPHPETWGHPKSLGHPKNHRGHPKTCQGHPK
ncbi:HAUS5 protein, partial [Pelecanoides urinatrix]|nr:HAUS5 protein [Pelecanoides urinatrix]